jgi:hypothetical protein
MKRFIFPLATALILVLSACSEVETAIGTNVAGEAAGLYRGTLVTPDGAVYENEDLEIHRVVDDRISVESTNTNNNNQGEGRFAGFEFRLMRSGAVIHHILGSETQGTFVLDAAVTPDELRIRLPNGMRYDAVRVKNYFE